MKSALKSMLLGFVATTAFLGLASQLDAKVAVTQSPSAALVRGSSFAWAPIAGQAYGYADPAIANEITGQRLRSAIETNLAKHGYRQTGLARADFLVSYRVVLQPRREAKLSGSSGFCGPRYCSMPGNYRLDTQNYTQGTLVLDLSEARSGRLVYRATSDKKLSAKDSTQQALDKLLASMTKALPAT
jgi:hypothetical protein